MSKSTVLLYSRYDRPNLGYVGSDLTSEVTSENWFYARETVKVQIKIYNGDDPLDLTGLTAAKLMAKDPADLTSSALISSTNLTSTAAQLLVGVLEFTNVSLNTVELLAYLAEAEKDVKLETIELVGGLEDRILSQGNVHVKLDVIRGNEGVPIYAMNLKHNTNASAAPTANDDSGDGYAVGSVWVFGNSIYICIASTLGAASWMDITNLRIEEITGFIEEIALMSYVLDQYAAYNYAINSLSAVTTSGSCNITVLIDGVPITGLTAIAVNDSEDIYNATAANNVLIGQTLLILVNSNAAAVDLAFTIKTTRS